MQDTFTGGSDGKASACNVGDLGFDPWVGKIPWRREWQPTPVFFPQKSHGERSLAGYSPWGLYELDMTKRLSTCKQNHWPCRWKVLWDSEEQSGRGIYYHYPHIQETHLCRQAKGRISAKNLLTGKGKSWPVHFTSVNMCLVWLLWSKCWVNIGKNFVLTTGSWAEYTLSLRW